MAMQSAMCLLGAISFNGVSPQDQVSTHRSVHLETCQVTEVTEEASMSRLLWAASPRALMRWQGSRPRLPPRQRSSLHWGFLRDGKLSDSNQRARPANAIPWLVCDNSSRIIDRSQIRERTRLSGSSSMLVVASASRLEIPSLFHGS
jgi:hypothetical protein